MFRRLFNSINSVRYFSYKPIKRPSLNSPSNKAYVENKLKEYDIAKVLRSKIEATGPITGKKLIEITIN